MILITLIINDKQVAEKWISHSYRSISDTRKLWHAVYRLSDKNFQIYITLKSKANAKK